MNSVVITGAQTITANINKAIIAQNLKSQAGLIKAAIIVRRAMETDSPKTPIDLGNLRASFFIATPGGTPVKDDNNEASQYSAQASGMGKPWVILGFTANYAIYVHEMVDADFKRPGSGAKFLETALKNNKAKMLKAIKGLSV